MRKATLDTLECFSVAVSQTFTKLLESLAFNLEVFRSAATSDASDLKVRCGSSADVHVYKVHFASSSLFKRNGHLFRRDVLDRSIGRSNIFDRKSVVFGKAWRWCWVLRLEKNYIYHIPVHYIYCRLHRYPISSWDF